MKATVCAAAGAIGLLALATNGPATAAPLVSFQATADADGARQTVVRPNAPLADQVVDSSFPSAQAVLDGLGNSQAYGSFLYPGASVVSAPGLGSGATGVSLPSYPVIASSSDPSAPKADASIGPVVSRAASTATMSRGEASFTSATGSRLEATATVTADRLAGTLSAVGAAHSSGIDAAGVLAISSVDTQAQASLAHGKVTSSSAVAIGRVAVAGIHVVLTDKGLSLPGMTAPLPDNSPVTTPLRDAGITITLVHSEKLVGGIRSGGVMITQTRATPDGGSETITTTYGQTIAIVTATSDSAAAPTFSAQPSVGDGFLTPTPPIAVPQLGAAAPITSPLQLGGATPTQPPAVSPPTASEVSAANLAIPFATLDVLPFYLILILAAAVIVIAHLALRRFGVSSIWTS